jgi:hypothetical protein
MYRVIELQTTGGTTAMIDHGDYAERNAAESKMHAVAQYAAISTVEIHTVEVLNPEGEKVNKAMYKHEQQQPEPAAEE